MFNFLDSKLEDKIFCYEWQQAFPDFNLLLLCFWIEFWFVKVSFPPPQNIWIRPPFQRSCYKSLYCWLRPAFWFLHFFRHSSKTQLKKTLNVTRWWWRGDKHTGTWWGNLRERDKLDDGDVDGRVTLKWILSGMGRDWCGMISFVVAEGGLNAVMNLRGTHNMGN